MADCISGEDCTAHCSVYYRYYCNYYLRKHGAVMVGQRRGSAIGVQLWQICKLGVPTPVLMTRKISVQVLSAHLCTPTIIRTAKIYSVGQGL